MGHSSSCILAILSAPREELGRGDQRSEKYRPKILHVSLFSAKSEARRATTLCGDDDLTGWSMRNPELTSQTPHIP